MKNSSLKNYSIPQYNVRNTENLNNKKRGQIVHAAARLFREFGFKGTSIKDIAKAVNLPKGGIYNYIKNKEELLYEIITHGILQFLPALREVGESKRDPTEKFRLTVYLDVCMLAQYHDFISVFFQDKKFLSRQHYQEYLGYRDEVEKIFKNILREGMKAGVFRKADLNLTAFAILGMCNWVTHWYRSDGSLSAEEIATFFADAAENMVRR